MLSNVKLLAAAGGLGLLAACAQQEEPMAPAPAPAEEPIYSKDGRIIGMRPTVAPGGNWGGDGSSLNDGLTTADSDAALGVTAQVDTNGDGVVNELDD